MVEKIDRSCINHLGFTKMDIPCLGEVDLA